MNHNWRTRRYGWTVELEDHIHVLHIYYYYYYCCSIIHCTPCLLRVLAKTCCIVTQWHACCILLLVPAEAVDKNLSAYYIQSNKRNWLQLLQKWSLRQFHPSFIRFCCSYQSRKWSAAFEAISCWSPYISTKLLF